MIRAVSSLPSLLIDSEAILRIAALWQAYGGEQTFCRFWQGESGIVAVCDGVATAHMGEDFEEIALFLTMSPDVRAVRTDADSAVKLAQLWDTKLQTGTVMRAERTLTPTVEATEVPPAEIYPLLNTVFGDTIPPFDAWYADVHHRYRRGLFRVAAVMQEGKPVSCAVTTAMCEGAALIGGVATLPTFRGIGYASQCVTTLARELSKSGHAVWISPKNEGAENLYYRLGFTPYGKWGVVEK